MAQTDGEKELVLGNKQLISLFFVVVALCGVFFAMGYMVRGNSIKGTVATGVDSTAPATTSEGQRQQPEPPAETNTQPPAPAPETTTPPAETRPVLADPPAPAPTSQETASAVTAPEAGASYLQVTALGRKEAESVVRTLREQKFPTILAASSKDGFFRVLVGPYHTTPDIADAKARLKTLGFAGAFVQKQ